MKHHIIVKFNEKSPKLDEMIPDIEKIFSGVLEVSGVKSYNLVKNCIDRSNRYNLMIIIDMDKSALEAYDNCHAHHQWKDNYSQFIESKAIFDSE
ncbi:MAG: hypothetical protein MJ182_05005 [Treponema sp.]|nr:hypothetical protein [Treponema sp.]